MGCFVTTMNYMDNMFFQDISGWCGTEPSDLPIHNFPNWGTCPSQATLTLTSSDSDNVVTWSKFTLHSQKTWRPF